MRESNETRQLPQGELTSQQRASLDYCFVVLIQMGPTPTYKCYHDIKLLSYNLQQRETVIMLTVSSVYPQPPSQCMTGISTTPSIKTRKFTCLFYIFYFCILNIKKKQIVVRSLESCILCCIKGICSIVPLTIPPLL